MISNVYFLRHCITTNNANKIISGRQDSPIIDNGVAITEFLVENIDKTLIYCSSLPRCVQTVNNLCKEIKFTPDIIIDEKLNERDMGIWEGKKKVDIINLYPRFFKFGKFIPFITPPGGESYNHFIERVDAFSLLLKIHVPEKPILICSSNQTLKLLYCALTHQAVHEIWYTSQFPNGKITVVPDKRAFEGQTHAFDITK